MLWGRAAGRCQFDNCNRNLTLSPVTKETRNLAEKAHIRAFSPGGPRADHKWPTALLQNIDNLLLLCHDCHVNIDRADGPTRYTVELLLAWKRRHEQRIEVVTDLAPRSSHIVTYGTHVGEHQALPTFRDASNALFPDSVPASTTMIALGTRDSARRDHDIAFWAAERIQLARQFDRQVRIPIESGELAHISVFALAPQPLLIDLGVLLGDITPAVTYQLHREPAGWAWPPEAEVPEFQVVEPDSARGEPVLLLSLSATVTPDRIKRVLGADTAIWTVTLPVPHNDVANSRAMQRAFRRTMRKVLDRLKAKHGHSTPVHVFPAMPASLAVEFGRVRMPKADSPWILYDEHQSRGGFLPAFTLAAETKS